MAETDSTPKLYEENNKESKFDGKVVLIMALVIPVAFFIFGSFWPDDSPYTYKSRSDDKVVSASASSQPAEALESEYKKQMRRLYGPIASMSEQMIKEQLSKPDTAKFTNNWAAFSNDGVVLTHSGTVTYNNKSGNVVTQNYEASFVLDKDYSGFSLALKMGDSMLYDKRKAIDKDGKIISQSYTFEGRGYGSQILDEPYNPDKWEKHSSDFNNLEPEMTFAEYTAIQTGMTYKEVCAIVGSYGTEMARSEIAGYQTVVVAWDGNGTLGSNANVTFQNGKVAAKAQVGLK